MHAAFSPFVEPRAIKSSLTQKNCSPEIDDFAKRKRAHKNLLDEELSVCTKMLMENMEQSMHSQKTASVHPATEEIHTDAYCEAVIQAYDETDDADRMDAMLLAINEIKKFVNKDN